MTELIGTDNFYAMPQEHPVYSYEGCYDIFFTKDQEMVSYCLEGENISEKLAECENEFENDIKPINPKDRQEYLRWCAEWDNEAGYTEKTEKGEHFLKYLEKALEAGEIYGVAKFLKFSRFMDRLGVVWCFNDDSTFYQVSRSDCQQKLPQQRQVTINI